jgi:hypothetical protein
MWFSMSFSRFIFHIISLLDFIISLQPWQMLFYKISKQKKIEFHGRP